jgi:hypothetical protein
MKKIGIAHDPDEVEVWHWQVSREDYELISPQAIGRLKLGRTKMEA